MSIIPKQLSNESVPSMMNNYVGRSLSPAHSCRYPYEASKQKNNQVDRNGQKAHGIEKNGTPHARYKYVYCKDFNDREFMSKESLPNDSLRLHERGEEMEGMGGSPPYQLPYFKKKLGSEQASFEEIADSIQYAIQYKPQSFAQQAQPAPNFEAESEEILFLKDKLVETHNKLIKELEKRNKLSGQLQLVKEELERQRKWITELQMSNRRLQKQMDGEGGGGRQYESEGELWRLEQLEGRYKEEVKKSGRLRDEIESMRSRMLEVVVGRNQLEEQNNGMRQKLENIDQGTVKYKMEIKEKEKTIEYLSQEVGIVRRKYEQCEQECVHRGEEMHQYNHLMAERQKILNSLQGEVKRQKQKSGSLLNQFTNLQAEHKGVLKKYGEMEQLCEKYRSEIYCIENRKEANSKNVHQQLEKLTNEFNVMNTLYKEKEREIERLRKYEQGERKKRNHENNKELANGVKNQQAKADHQTGGGAHGRNKDIRAQNGKNSKVAQVDVSDKKHMKNQVHLAGQESSGNYQENGVESEPNGHDNLECQEQKGRYMSFLSQVGVLQSSLLNSNIAKKKIIEEMDRIDDTKIKKKQMIKRRRELEEELKKEEERIKKMKEELRKVKSF